jgi:hypothetical protein
MTSLYEKQDAPVNLIIVSLGISFTYEKGVELRSLPQYILKLDIRDGIGLYF